ncbi:MarR family transcriptional regulator [Paractinoplanes ferrugineus]|uniref:MarR family transcriptional regulator n=1 Tax=Paractinoplanes ferrugineus TaxID=113564 RepID=A0A919J3B7_9ACTN|nr:MarR family transcriptional regulator [Actinoplanes ferrugineus]GIE13178.1 MarR family transcriptional regulator [Actinoplanes ferrugineus]
MSSVLSGEADDRRGLTTQIKAALRDLRNELSILNRQVSARIAVKDGDLDCLDLITRHGPLSPSGLARLAGVHPATLTGILDRLERAGWVARERDVQDRRAVLVRALPQRSREVFHLYAGMNSALDEICAGYDQSQLEVVADFMRRAADAGKNAAQELADGEQAAHGKPSPP